MQTPVATPTSQARWCGRVRDPARGRDEVARAPAPSRAAQCHPRQSTVPEPSRNAAAAGIMLLLTIVLCAGVGAGVGAAVGEPGLVAAGGGFVGIFLGFALVYARYKQI